MEQNIPNTQPIVRRMCLLTVLVSSACFALMAFIFSPIYIRFASDVVYADSWWVYILYYLVEEDLLAHTVYAVCYPAAIYAVWKAGLKGAIRVPLSFALITLARFVADFFMTAVADSALPNLTDFLSFDLPYITTLYLLEMLQYALVIAITWEVKRRYLRKRAAAAAESLLESGCEDSEMPLFPFVRLVSAKNPLQLSALLMALVVFLLRFGSHQIYQLTLYAYTGYTDGLLVMVLDLFADIFVGVIFYFVALLLLSRFHRKEMGMTGRGE